MNHGHGGHEHRVRRGFSWVRFHSRRWPQGVTSVSFKKMTAGSHLCTLQENPHFWVPTIKVRPPDGIYSSSLILFCSLFLSPFIFTSLASKVSYPSAVENNKMQTIHHNLYQTWIHLEPENKNFSINQRQSLDEPHTFRLLLIVSKARYTSWPRMFEKRFQKLTRKSFQLH